MLKQGFCRGTWSVKLQEDLEQLLLGTDPVSLGRSILQNFSTEKLYSLEALTVTAREMETSVGGWFQGSKITAEVPLSQLRSVLM